MKTHEKCENLAYATVFTSVNEPPTSNTPVSEHLPTLSCMSSDKLPTKPQGLSDYQCGEIDVGSAMGAKCTNWVNLDEDATFPTALTSTNDPLQVVNCVNEHLPPLSHMSMDMPSTSGQVSDVNIHGEIDDQSVTTEVCLEA